MKNAAYFCLASIAFSVLSGLARADGPGPAFNPYVQTDGDGIPLVVTHPELAPLNPEEKLAIQKEEEKKDNDKDWLMRIYAARMQQRAAAHPTSNSQPLFYQISSNKELARLAGLHEDASADNKDHNDANSANNTRPAATPGTRTAPGASVSNLSHAYQFKPLVSPTSSLNMFGMHDNGSTPVESTSYAAKRAADAKSQDVADLQTPGMIAAKDGKEPDLGSPDLTLDLLPGESMEQARIEQAHAKSLALADPLNKNPEPPRVPGLKTTSISSDPGGKALPVPVAKVAPERDYDTPIPVSKAPIVVPGHAPIANPADVFDR
jgi:hypothetical protein